jgi:hypothetical protein
VLRPRCAIALLLVSIACSLPATSFAAYRSKAIDAVEEAVSQARTAILTADLASRDRLLAPSVKVQLEEAEAAATSAVDGFAAVLPPDPDSDALRRRLLPILGDVVDLIASMRFEAARGNTDELVRIRPSLSGPTDRLDAWAKAHDA